MQVPLEVPQPKSWSVDRSSELYRLDLWADGQFAISPHGDLLARLCSSDGKASTVSVPALVRELAEEGKELPASFFFPDILGERLRSLDAGLDLACQARGCPGRYLLSYPLRVNARAGVVRALLAEDLENAALAFEVSGRVELAIAVAEGSPGRTAILCSGSKDGRYARAALAAAAEGFEITFMLESSWEIDRLLGSVDKAEGIPDSFRLGIRIRPTAADGPERPLRFGFTPPELDTAIGVLRKARLLERVECLQIRVGAEEEEAILVEAIGYYRALREAGLPLTRIGIAGGKGPVAPELRGEGAESAEPFGVEKVWQAYTDRIVGRIVDGLEPSGEPIPTIVVEEGHALVGLAEVVVAEVLGVRSREEQHLYRALAGSPEPLRILSDLISEAPIAVEPEVCLAEARRQRTEARKLFGRGELDFDGFAEAERLFGTVLAALRERLPILAPLGESQAEIAGFGASLYDLNLRFAQSLPEASRGEGAFPVLPIERLGDCPDRMAILTDVTGEESNVLARFVDRYDDVLGIPLHTPFRGRGYAIAIAGAGAQPKSGGGPCGEAIRVTVALVDGTPGIVSVEPAESASDLRSRLGFEGDS